MPPHTARQPHHRLTKPTSKSAYIRSQASHRGTPFPPKADAERSSRFGSAGFLKESAVFLHRPIWGEAQLCAERCRNSTNLAGKTGTAKSDFVPDCDSGAAQDRRRLPGTHRQQGPADRAGTVRHFPSRSSELRSRRKSAVPGARQRQRSICVSSMKEDAMT